MNFKNNNVNTYTQAADDHTESIVAFHHADAAWQTKVDSVMDSTRDTGFYGDANLAEYLQRPVKILDANWTVTAGSYQTSFDPWTLFLEDANVRKRVEGYRLFQGTLNLRFAINGGPFFYGRAIAAYMPHAVYNEHSFGAANGDFYKAQLSMLPHIYLDPTTSEGGELVCPFLCPDNWIDLAGASYEIMGRVHMQSLNDLLHANSSTGTVNITCYAWMTNVRLAAPTMNTYGAYTAHSGEELAYGAAGVSIVGALLAWAKSCHSSCTYDGEDETHDEENPQVMEAHAGDEYGTGIISKPASVVAKVAGMLSHIPAIRPYARPSEMVANAVGRAAHIFGFSRPPVVSDIERVKNKGAGDLTHTDAHEAVVKLSLDSKQELSVDPRTVGLSDVDEMAFDYIKQKEMFVGTYEWSESDVSGSQIGPLVVGPDQHIEETIGGVRLNLLAPMYTLAVPFKHWKGSIKFRFMIAASQLHRGRIKISYDPYTHTASPDENEVYSRIVDLATNRDFEMLIAWNHPQGWLRVLDRLGAGTYGNPQGTNVTSQLYHNGNLRIEVVNELTSPNPALSQPVYINIFASAGEDFELANPTDDILSVVEYEPQGGGLEMEPQGDGEEIVDEQDNVPESPTPISSIGHMDGIDNPATHVYFGESVKSIRALLKRYCYHMAYMSPSASTHVLVESNFPVEPGQGKAPRHTTDATATPASTAYTYSSMTYLNWFTPCYIGWRGGLRSKYIVPANDGTYTVRRFTEPVNQADCGFGGFTGSSSDEGRWAYETNAYLKVGAGHDVTLIHTDGAVEVEFPYYNHKRFSPARRFLSGTGSSGNEWLGENAGHMLTAKFGFGTRRTMDRYVAAGDDFSLFMFVGQPGVLKRTKPLADGAAGTPLPSY